MGFTGSPRISARGVILDADGKYVVLRRRTTSGQSYLVFPGGGVANGESLPEAVQRECFEELGAVVTVGEVLFVAFQDEPAPGGLQRFFLCRLVSIDDSIKTGHEFSEPDRGSYETVHLAPDDVGFADLRPVEVAQLIRQYHPHFVNEAAGLR